jgi:Domain of unknown function (DUF4388)
MAPMSTAEEASALLASLEAGRQTGCLTVDSADGRVCRVYVLMGKAFHAEGPAGEGEPALADALSWPDVTLSFDEKAHLPDKQTMTWGSDITDSSNAANTGRLSMLSGNRRLIIAMLTYLGAGCLFVLVMVVGIGVAIVGGASHFRDDSVLGAFVVLLFATGLLWYVLYFRYRFIFRSAAVEIQDGLAKADIPSVIDAPGLVSGEPEVVVKLPAWYLPGRLGKCRVEFYATGVQIWKGPNHPELRWQFPYKDLLQAESVVMEAMGTRHSKDQYSLRLIAAQPRMAFLFGSSFTNRDTNVMLEELRKHGVRTFTEP